MDLNIQDTFNKELPADPIKTNQRRQVTEACFSYVTPRVPSSPKLLHVSTEVAQLLGLSTADIQLEDFLQVFSGAKILENTAPYAMCYGGHQFGHWAGQLGDGRAINLAEVVHEDQRWAMQLKGAGETPYSRRADGLAVLRSSIREHLCSEAMYHLGVPTTRSLSLSLTGDEVLRDVMYDGNPAYEKGAVVCRVSPSFIRFGNFQIFLAREDKENLRELTNYTIRHFFPHLQWGTKEGYISFFRTVAQRTLDMVIHWQRVGFVHGVMNTDNMSILGLTIDYGPYGWLEGYDPDWTPNTTDRENKRYRYSYQPGIAHWNLAQLANALYFLVDEEAPFQKILEEYEQAFPVKYVAMMRKKMGLANALDTDPRFIDELQKALALTETDMTIFFRLLAQFDSDKSASENLKLLEPAFYTPIQLVGNVRERWFNWLEKYADRLKQESHSNQERITLMNS
ncbi:MAG: YdiU family protein, partial [Bacteroidota bacterium]